MYQDLFNNISNDYIYPDLPPCPDNNGSGNDVFKFLPGNQVGIVSGSNILGAMNLSDIMLNIDSWTIQTKILEPGEVTYIAGLTKGISFKNQNFLLNASIGYNNSFMSIDMSINYYNNFSLRSTYVAASSNYNAGISLDSALNILFGNNGINIEATYNADEHRLSFLSTKAGYYFDITRVNASTWDTPNPSEGTVYHGGPLLNDPSTDLPAYKYPNTAMLGYILKVAYPNGILLSERFVEVNHVTNDFTYFKSVDVSVLKSFATYTDASYYDYDVSSNIVDVSVFQTQATYDSSSFFISQTDAVEVGSSISAGNYLSYIQTNNLWEKIGLLQIWLSAEDPASSQTENLISGFYVFNPQGFPVRLDYMIIA